MSFPRYPAYRMTGIEWLPEVPAHWDVLHLKQACNVFPSNVDKKSVEGEQTVLLCNYTDVYHNDRIGPELDFMVATATEDQIKRFNLRAGDTIITKDSESADDIAVSAFVPADLPGVICGYHLSVVRPKTPHCGAFVKRLFDSAYAKACVAVLANGLTRVALGQYDLDNLELPFPPPTEQEAIADFLNRETAMIDELVEQQRRLIALLEEKRQAVISHAVTRGLNPLADLRDSGVNWIGSLPVHWRVERSRRLFSLREERAREADAQLTASQKYGVVHQSTYTELEGAKVVQVIKGADILKHVEPGDFVISMRSFQGGIEFSPFRGCVSSAYVVLTPKHPDSIPYFARVLKSRVYVQALQATSNLVRDGQALRYGNFVLVDLPWPPMEEQIEIASYLDSETQKIGQLAAQAGDAIALLLERRAALITAAVTGQIDVRALAPIEAP